MPAELRLPNLLKERLNHTISYPGYSNSRIGVEGVKELASFLRDMPNLTTLDVRYGAVLLCVQVIS